MSNHRFLLLLLLPVSSYPNIHLYRLGKTVSPHEMNQVGRYMLKDPRWKHWDKWIRADTNRVKMETYSAICLIHAEQLTDTLRREWGVTRHFGLIMSTLSSSMVEHLGPREAVEKCYASNEEIVGRFNHRDFPFSCGYNAMFHPFIRHTIKGMLWYQGTLY